MKQFLWVEKYRPKKIDDCILTDDLKSRLKSMLDQGQIQNMIFSGPPGTGKTTAAKALCNELGVDYLIINASENGNIDTLRTTIRDYASCMSLDGSIRCVILDEADYLNAQSTQPALRNFIEEFSAVCRFILTVNYPNRIIEPLKSRCHLVDFTIPRAQKKEIATAFGKRVQGILKEEDIKLDKKYVARVVVETFPDFRKALNVLQYATMNGTEGGDIEQAGIVTEKSVRELFALLPDISNWEKVRKWVIENNIDDLASFSRILFDVANDYVEFDSMPQLVLTLAEYDYKAAFVSDKEINIVAMLTEIMAQVKFK